MKKTFSIDGSPETHILDSFMNSKVTYPEALSELIDNSFDQSANNVEIVLNGQSVIVSDDGNGCSNLQSMLRMGSHTRTATTKLGRYGVGLKNVSLALGELLEIKTRQSGTQLKASVDWPKLRDSGNWSEIKGEEQETDLKNGTDITISQLHSSIFKFQFIISAIAFNFAPALWSGKVIHVKTDKTETKVTPWEIPEMSSLIEMEDTHPTGVGYRVRAGIVDQNLKEPFILSYEHRIIAGTSEPCGALSSSDRFMGFVELFGKWPFLKHKDGLRDCAETEWLYESLFSVCEPILRNLHKQGDEVELSEIASELQTQFGHLFRNPKRPGTSNQKGSTSPRNTDRKVKEAEVVGTEEGDVSGKANKLKRGFNLRYANLEKGHIGKVNVNKKRVEITLNKKHKLIEHYRSKQNRKLELKHISVTLLCHQQSIVKDPKQMLLKLEGESSDSKFIELYSSLSGDLCERHAD